MEKLTPFDAAEYLDDKELQARYLVEVAKENLDFVFPGNI